MKQTFYEIVIVKLWLHWVFFDGILTPEIAIWKNRVDRKILKKTVDNVKILLYYI